MLDLELSLLVLVDGQRVDHAHRVAFAQPLQLGDDLAVELRVVEAQHDELNRSNCHVYDSFTEEESTEPEELLNSKLTVACLPLEVVMGQVTVVPGFTGTVAGQFTVAPLMPASARSCSISLSTVEPGSTTLPALKA